MNSGIKNVLVIGAGGNLGPSVLKALEQHSAHYTVSVLSRVGSKSKFPSHTKVYSVQESQPEDEIMAAFKGQDAVIDLTPLGKVDQSKKYIDLAIKAGVKRFVPGEFGSNTAEDRVNAAIPVFAAKVAIREYLKSKESQGLTWTGVVNGAFFDWCLAYGVIGFDLKNQTALIHDSGNVRFHTTTLAHAGLGIAGALADPRSANRYIYVASFYTTQNEILASLEKATGSKWKTEHTTSAAELKKGQEALAQGDFSGFGPAICGVQYSGEDWSDYGKKPYELWNEELGLPKVNVGMDEVVKGVVESSKSS